ncbi:MAG: Gfo/Idh/MocA family oxidoreductase, partial [Deltaproteobacteria bacterium]|nr:Gfo/Idh/MocA family oxidoreductase [Deltaproteobacteria bacterium]
MTKKEKLGIGMIGCGRIAQAHLLAIEALKEKVDLIAVADVDEKKAGYARERFKAKNYSTHFDDFLHHPEIDAVIITLPNHL